MSFKYEKETITKRSSVDEAREVTYKIEAAMMKCKVIEEK